MLFYGFQVYFRQFFQLSWEIVRELLREVHRVKLIFKGAEYRYGAVRVVDVVVAVLLLIPSTHRSPTPKGALDFTGFGLHHGAMPGIDPLFVALPAGLLIDGHGCRMTVERLQSTPSWGACVSHLRVIFLFRVTAMAYDAPVGVSQLLARFVNLFCHL